MELANIVWDFVTNNGYLNFENFGLFGLFVSAFICGMILPLSSELVLFSLVGFGYRVFPCIAVAYFGSLGGCLLNYFLGYLGKWEWVERYLRIKRERIESQQHRLEKFGIYLASFSWVPILGPLFPLALGFFRVNKWGTLLFLVIGQICRYAVAAYICIRFIK